MHPICWLQKSWNGFKNSPRQTYHQICDVNIVIYTQKFTPRILAGPSTDPDTHRHWDDRARTVSLSCVNCHCLVRTGILPVKFVYSLILISGESSGLHPVANWFNKQHLSLEEENMILQWEHVNETSISGYDLGLLQRAALQKEVLKDKTAYILNARTNYKHLSEDFLWGKEKLLL